MSSIASGHPIRKSLRRKLTNGDPFDNYGGFDSDDATPTYTLLFQDNPGCTYYMEFLEGQFFTQYSGQSVTVTFYLNGNTVKQEVCGFLLQQFMSPENLDSENLVNLCDALSFSGYQLRLIESKTIPTFPH